MGVQPAGDEIGQCDAGGEADGVAADRDRRVRLARRTAKTPARRRRQGLGGFAVGRTLPSPRGWRGRRVPRRCELAGEGVELPAGVGAEGGEVIAGGRGARSLRRGCGVRRGFRREGRS